jgi:hypothetical protein
LGKYRDEKANYKGLILQQVNVLHPHLDDTKVRQPFHVIMDRGRMNPYLFVGGGYFVFQDFSQQVILLLVAGSLSATL